MNQDNSSFKEMQSKVNQSVAKNKELLRQYAIPVEVFVKSIEGNEDVVWHRMEKFNQTVAEFDAIIERMRSTETPKEKIDELMKTFENLTKEMYPVILMDSEQELYGIYVRGADISKLKTIGGKVFSEVANKAEQLGVYNPMRHNIGKHV